MIPVFIVLYILFFHWIGDFVAQTNQQAINKSHDFNMLIDHTCMYSLIMTVAIGALMALKVPNLTFYEYSIRVLAFMSVTLVIHTFQDFFTSRINKKILSTQKAGNHHLFFVSVGFDQFLHFCQLLILYKLIS